MTAALRLPAWPAARVRRWYRGVYAVPLTRVAAAAVAVPAAGILLAVLAGGTARVPVLTLALGAATVTDLLWRRIFNWVPVAAVGWVAGLHLLAPGAGWTGLPSALESAAGFGACLGMMLALYAVFGGGEGDVKLVAAVGAVVGPWHGIEAVAFAYVLAAGVALVLLAGRRAGLRHAAFQARPLPMAPFVAAGVALTLGLPGGG